MISWMEKELKQQDMAVVLVTHDRYFMVGYLNCSLNMFKFQVR